MLHGARRWLIVAGMLALAALLAAFVAVYLLLQPDRFTTLLQQQAQDAGLALNLDSPASPTLFPRPALELSGITLNAKGASRPILLASHGRLVLPWRTLLGGPTAIARMEVDAPRVDLDALQDWLAALPPRAENLAPTIPRIDAGIRVEHGSVVHGDRLLLDNVSLTAGTLAPGQPFPLEASASTAAGAPLRLRLSATPRLQDQALRVDNIQLHLSQGSSATLTLEGDASWRGGANATVKLGGKLDHADAGNYIVRVALSPANQSDPLLLHLQLDGPGNHADLRLPPLALAHWWNELAAPAGHQSAGATDPLPRLPPGSGSVEIAKLQLGSLHVEGLSVHAGDDVPAVASSTAPTATAK